MKNSKHGWGISTEIIFLFMFIICLLIAIYFIGRAGLLASPEEKKIENARERIEEVSGRNTTYTDLEDDLKSAARRYVSKNYDSLGIDTLIITSKRLIESDYLDVMNDPDKNGSQCSGYVEVEKNDNSVTYSPYINCSKYHTDGYVKRKDI